MSGHGTRRYTQIEQQRIKSSIGAIKIQQHRNSNYPTRDIRKKLNWKEVNETYLFGLFVPVELFLDPAGWVAPDEFESTAVKRLCQKRV